jgi:hypothetical protein
MSAHALLDDDIGPSILYGAPVKLPSGRCVVPTASTDGGEFLIKTGVCKLLTKPGCEDKPTLILPDAAIAAFRRISEHAVHTVASRSAELLRGKDVGADVLASLWREDVTKAGAQVEMQINVSDDFTAYNEDQELLTESVPSGTSVLALLRLDELWISRSRLGHAWSLVQIMTLNEPEAGTDADSESDKHADTGAEPEPVMTRPCMLDPRP